MSGKKVYEIFIISCVGIVLMFLLSEKKADTGDLTVSKIFKNIENLSLEELINGSHISEVCSSSILPLEEAKPTPKAKPKPKPIVKPKPKPKRKRKTVKKRDKSGPGLLASLTSTAETVALEDYIFKIYKKGELGQHELSFDAFKNALVGFFNLLKENKVKNDRMISIVDYDMPSSKERMFIIDLKEQKLVKKLLVSHGKKSGGEYASNFSNTPSSHQSSLGFYRGSETYDGKYGYSLRLDGLEDSINCKARERAIVMHGAEYVSDSFIKENGRLGRSYGCLALDYEEIDAAIEAIKAGTCIYVHKSLPNYLNSSKLLNLISSSEFFKKLFTDAI